MATTNFDVNVGLHLNDQLSRRLTGVDRNVKRTTRSLGFLRSALVGFAAFHVARSMFEPLIRGLIDFNKQIETTKIGLSGIIQLNMGTPFKEARLEANQLFKELQEDARRSLGTTKEFTAFAANIAAPVLGAGGKLRDLREITRSAIVAGQAMGERADLVQLDIQQFLQGRLTARDRFARKLIEPAGLDTQQVNKMSEAARFRLLKDLLNQPAIKEMAEAFEKSFAGRLSTLKDNLEITFGKIGLPLVEAITEEMRKWNEMFDNDSTGLRMFVRDFSKGIMTAFKAVKSAVELIVSNKDFFFEVIKSLAIIKGVNIVTGFGAGHFAGKAGMAGVTASAAARHTRNARALGAAGPITMAGLLGIDLLMGHLNKELDQEIKKENREGSIRNLFAKQGGIGPFGTTRGFFERRTIPGFAQQGKELGLIEDGVLKFDKAIDFFEKKLLDKLIEQKFHEGTIIGQKLRAPLGLGEGLLTEAEKNQMRKAKEDMLNNWIGFMSEAADMSQTATLFSTMEAKGKEFKDLIEELKKDKAKGKPKVNVQIKMDVTTNDPDRFVHDVNDLIEDVIRNPVSAKRSSVMRGGMS